MKRRVAREPTRPYRVGLTGGIASGKTAVAAMFSELGVPVIDTDVLAREVVAKGSPGLADVTAAFGRDVLDADGTLNRRMLRERIFDSAENRRRLEAILHPRILAAMESASATAGGPYQILVIPLLFESGLENRVHRILVVDCPEAFQRARLRDRDHESAAGIDRLLAAQTDRATRLAGADDVIDNGGTLAQTRRAVAELDRRYRVLAAENAEGDG